MQTIRAPRSSKRSNAPGAIPVLRNARAGVGDKPGGERSARGGVSRRAARHVSQPAAGHRWRAWTMRRGRRRRCRPRNGCPTTRCTAIPSHSRPRCGSATTATRSISPSAATIPSRGRIKTSITRRDNIWSDDWVGLSLDALGTGQASYHLMVNPSGIQLDMLNTPAGGRGHLARLGVAERGPDHRQRLRGRDSSAAADDPLQGRRRRADGHPLLAPRQPHRRVGVVAGARAGQVGVPEEHEDRVRGHHGPADARDDSVGHVLPRPGARDACRVGRRPTTTATSV